MCMETTMKQAPNALSVLVRSVVGKATSRQIARMIEARGGGTISHTTVAALLRGAQVSEATLLSFSLAFGVAYNQLRELAGLGPLSSQPWANMDNGRQVVLVPDLAAVLAEQDGWADLDEMEQGLAIEIGRQQLQGMVQAMRHTKESSNKCVVAR